MTLPTGSELERALACPASCYLPRDPRLETEWSQRGTAVHRCAEDRTRFGLEQALSKVPPEWRELCEAIPWEDIPAVSAEVALAWDHASGVGRLLDPPSPRDYSSAPPSEFCLTVDLLGGAKKEGAEGVYVGDIKTGWSTLQPPAHAPQLLLGALAATRCPGVAVEFARLQWVRIDEEGNLWTPSADVDLFDLACFADRLREFASELAERPSPRSGPHCHYCPCLGGCPAQQEVAALALVPDELAAPWWPGDPREAYELTRRIAALHAYSERRIRAMAKECPIELGDGLVFGPRTIDGNERIDGVAAFPVLLAEVGPERAMACIEPRISKASLKRGLGKDAKKAITKLRAAGAIAKTPRNVIDEHD